MSAKRFLLSAIALALLLPLAGCGGRRNCSSSGSFAPPPQPCCNQPLPPGAVPGP